MPSVLRPLLHEVSDKGADKILARQLREGPWGNTRDLIENRIGKTVGGGLVAGGEAIAKGVFNAGKSVLKGTGNLAKGIASKVEPNSVKAWRATNGIGPKLDLDLGNPSHRLIYDKVHGLESSAEDIWKGRNKTLERGMLLGTVALPAGVIAQQGNKDVLNDLNTATQTGVRQVTANDKSLEAQMSGHLANAREKLAAPRGGGGGGNFGDGSGRHPMAGMGEAITGGAMNQVGEVFRPASQSLGYSLQKRMFPMEHRIRAGDAFAESAVKELGKQTGTYAGNIMQGVMDSGLNAGREAASWSPQRKQIFDQLMATDPVLSRADPEMVLQAYHSMKRFAPLLSTDPHATQAFLREAVVHEGSMNYNTMGALAKAETEARRALGMV